MGTEISDPVLIEQIGQFFLDEMVERTESGKDINGHAFDSYSPEYVASEDFKLYGKSKRDINLTLKGDMLNSMDFTSSSDVLTFGFPDNQVQKAANHNKGVTVPKRQFFGITDELVRKAKKEFSSELQKEKETSSKVIEQGFKTLADYFLESKSSQESLNRLIDSLFASSFDVEGL